MAVLLFYFNCEGMRIICMPVAIECTWVNLKLTEVNTVEPSVPLPPSLMFRLPLKSSKGVICQVAFFRL
jgi:hypothetical protein